MLRAAVASSEQYMNTRRRGAAVRFVVPSALGVLIFLTPIMWDGSLTIGIGVATQWVIKLMGAYGLHLVVLVMTVTALLTVLGSIFKLRIIQTNPWLAELFDVSLPWVALRLAGMSFGFIYLFQFGPELLRSEEIGGAVMLGIGVNVIAVYISACLLLPLLTEFGFMEFVGTLARPLFRRVFRLPGRAAIDATASFVGAGSIGLLITLGQYERGYYSAREASVIATNFSIVSIPFALVVARVAGIEALFVPWYGVVVATCLLIAMITPRLKPLSAISDSYNSAAQAPASEQDTEAVPLLRAAWDEAMARAQGAPGIKQFLSSGLSSLAFFLFTVIAASLAVATLASLITFHTPVVRWLSTPLIYVLEVLKLPGAEAAAPGLLAGLMDQFIPAVVASGIEASTTSFLLAGLAVCQLIFMSEIGILILRSKLPLGLRDLVVIFVIRTMIAVPALALGAHLIAG